MVRCTPVFSPTQGPSILRPLTPAARGCVKARLVDSPEEAARIAQNLRADERIGVGTHLGAAPPIHGAGVPCLDPLGTGLRRESVGMNEPCFLLTRSALAGEER